MTLHILFPGDPVKPNRPDEGHKDEFVVANKAGLTCSLFSVEDFERGEFRPCPSLSSDDDVLYRGWMLTPRRYAELQSQVEVVGARTITTHVEYRKCHYLPEWYAQCEEFTPKTIFLSRDDDFAAALLNTGWSAYFVKDYVKSLTTSRGSIARNVEQVREIVDLIEKYRGQVEGGICVREFESLRAETEERYFAFRGKAFSRTGMVPELVESIAARIDSPFFSIDVVQNSDGILRLIELGDGQVSDRKKWSAENFVQMLVS